MNYLKALYIVMLRPYIISIMFFGILSLLLLRVEVRGCCTLLSPMRQTVIYEYGFKNTI